MPGLLDADALQAALTALSSPAAPTGGATPEPDRAATTLAFRVLGAAEGHAKRAQDAARATGPDGEVLIAEAFGAAGCENELDALALLRWRAARLSEALAFADLGGPYGVKDRMMGTIVVAATALARMVDAAYVMRDPDSTAPDQRTAAEDWWAATGSLRQAVGADEVRLAAAPGHEHGPQGCPDCR